MKLWFKSKHECELPLFRDPREHLMEVFRCECGRIYQNRGWCDMMDSGYEWVYLGKTKTATIKERSC